MILFVLSLFLFALALLVVLPPPATPFWLLSVPVKEWGHWFALLCLPLLWPGLIHGWMGLASALLAASACILFLLPLITAMGALCA